MTGKVSIIIPVLNEVEELEQLLPFLLKMPDTHKEVILAISSNDQSDYTSIVKDPSIICHNCLGAGRAVQMNEGAKVATGDVFLFVHADVRPPVSAIEDIKKSIQGGHSAGFFAYDFDSDSRWLKINASATRKDAWYAGGGDQCQWMTRSVFEELGAYNDNLCIMEDFDMIKKWRDRKIAYQVIQNPALVSARKYKNNSYLWVNFVNLVTMLCYKVGMNNRSLKRMYSRLL